MPSILLIQDDKTSVQAGLDYIKIFTTKISRLGSFKMVEIKHKTRWILHDHGLKVVRGRGGPRANIQVYWCLTEFIDWRYSQSCGIFDPSCELAPL